MSRATLVLKNLLKYQAFSFKYYLIERWQKLADNMESQTQVSNVHLIKSFGWQHLHC